MISSTFKPYNSYTRTLMLAIIVSIASSCTYVNVDKIELTQSKIIKDGASIVIIRNQQNNVKTEASIVSCLGNQIEKGNPNIKVINEKDFIDSFYPWFEPSTAPITPTKLEELMLKPLIKNKIAEINLDYLIWLQGSTKTHDDKLAMACSLNGCLGFGSWKNTENLLSFL